MTHTIELAQHVLAHAHMHYENGWDVVVECYELSEIAEQLTSDMTPADAVSAIAVAFALEAHNDRRNDALAAGGLKTSEFHSC